MNERWMAVHTHAQKEAFANMHLKRVEEVETFFPHYRDRQWSGKSKMLSELAYRAYLPRYIFARAPLRRVAEINKAPGVATVLHRPGGEPCPIPEDVMIELFKATDNHGWVHRYLEKKQDEFGGEPGDTIRLGEKSPLFGFTATISRVIDNKKILCKLEAALFGVVGREIEVPITEIGELLPVGSQDLVVSSMTARTA